MSWDVPRPRFIVSAAMIEDQFADRQGSSADDALVHLTVRCTLCGHESRKAYPALVIVVALTEWKQMALQCECRSDSYSASPSQLDSIREQVGSDWIAEHIRLRALGKI